MKRYILLIFFCPYLHAMFHIVKPVVVRQSLSTISATMQGYATQSSSRNALAERIESLERLSWGLDEDRASKALHSISITLANMHQEQLKAEKDKQQIRRERLKIEQQQLKQAKLQTKVHGTLGALACAILYQQLGNRADEQEVRLES